MTGLKNARIEVRLPEDLKVEFEAAAAYLGQSISEFVVTTVRARAIEVREQKARTVLSERDRDRFLAALEEAEPNEALRASAEKYKAFRRSSDLAPDDRAAS